MFNHFDEVHQQSAVALMACDDMEGETGLIYFVVNLDAIPVLEENGNRDYNRMERYYILHHQE
jgi:hypothetical protein